MDIYGIRVRLRVLGVFGARLGLREFDQRVGSSSGGRSWPEGGGSAKMNRA